MLEEEECLSGSNVALWFAYGRLSSPASGASAPRVRWSELLGVKLRKHEELIFVDDRVCEWKIEIAQSLAGVRNWFFERFLQLFAEPYQRWNRLRICS